MEQQELNLGFPLGLPCNDYIDSGFLDPFYRLIGDDENVHDHDCVLDHRVATNETGYDPAHAISHAAAHLLDYCDNHGHLGVTSDVYLLHKLSTTKSSKDKGRSIFVVHASVSPPWIISEGLSTNKMLNRL